MKKVRKKTYHSMDRVGSSVGISLASKWAFSPSRRLSLFSIGTVNLGATPDVGSSPEAAFIFKDSSWEIFSKVFFCISPGTWGVKIRPDFSVQVNEQVMESVPCLFVALHS